MPKYYKYDANNNDYNEVTYENVLKQYNDEINKYKSILAKDKLHTPVSRQDIVNIINIYTNKLNDIEKNIPQPPQLPARPQEPSKTEKKEVFGHGAASFADYDAPPIFEQIPRDNSEYERDLDKYRESLKGWNADKEKANTEYEAHLAEYKNKFTNEIIIHRKIKTAFDDIDHKIESSLNKSIKIPTSDEVFKAFNDKINNDGMKASLHSQKRIDQLNELAEKIKLIHESADTDSIKSSKMLSATLDTYRMIIRSFTGTPTLYGLLGKGSNLGRALYAFCKDVYDVELPKTLGKGQPLAINQPPLCSDNDSNTVCHYFKSINNEFKFTLPNLSN